MSETQTIDELIAEAEQNLLDLKQQKQDSLGLANKYRVIERITGNYVGKTFVLLPERSAHDRVGLAAVADSLEAAGIKPALVSGIRNWIIEIEAQQGSPTGSP